MWIESVRIKNLRSFADVTVPLNKYACLVGPNGAGKSTVLCALNVFFRETNDVSTNLIQLSAEDFHQRNTKEPIEITVTFTDLSPEAQSDFAEYYRQEKLIVSAIARFDEGTGKAEVKQTGQRLVMDAFKDFFKALGDRRPVSELKQHFSDIREKVPQVTAASTKDAMIEALRTYEAQHPEECELIPSEDHFYGATKGAHRLGKYLQWVYVPAVKDASTEQVEARNTGLPEETIWGGGFVMWKSDIGRIVEDDVGTVAWTEAQNKADELYGLIGNLKKNTLHIGAKLAHTWAIGKTSPQLERLCNEILNPQMSV